MFRSCLGALQYLMQQSLGLDHAELLRLMTHFESDFLSSALSTPVDRAAVLPFLLTILRRVLRYSMTPPDGSSSEGIFAPKLLLSTLETTLRCFGAELAFNGSLGRNALLMAILVRKPQDCEKSSLEILVLLVTALELLRPRLLEPAPAKQGNADDEALGLAALTLVETIVSALSQSPSSPRDLFSGPFLAQFVQVCLLFGGAQAVHGSRAMALLALGSLRQLLVVAAPRSSPPLWADYFPGIFSSLFVTSLGGGPGGG